MESKEQLAALFFFATEGILIVNERGEIIKINPAGEKMFGYEHGELEGKKIETLIPARFTHLHEKQRTDYIERPQARPMGIGMELYAVRKNSTEFPVEISLSPYHSEGGNFVIAFILDVTIRKKAEDEIKRKNAQLKELNMDLESRVKERTMILEEAVAELNKTKKELDSALEQEKELNKLKSRFVAMASHEFRTPLATILSSLSLVTKYGEQNDKEKQTKHISRIKSTVTMLTDILNDVLSISKLEEGGVTVSPEELNIKELADEVIREMQVIAKKGQDIKYTHQGGEVVCLDKKFIRYMLFNLISNAVKFSPEGRPIEVTTNVGSENLKMSIRDSGIGIAEEDQKHLFERFFRAQNATNIQGTGLGLSIVAKHVEMLNGKIEFESALEEGTTFYITLPKEYVTENETEINK